MYVGAENSVKTMHKKIVGYPFLVGLHTFDYFFYIFVFCLDQEQADNGYPRCSSYMFVVYR